jgi:hypothetical protein
MGLSNFLCTRWLYTRTLDPPRNMIRAFQRIVRRYTDWAISASTLAPDVNDKRRFLFRIAVSISFLKLIKTIKIVVFWFDTMFQ